MASEQSTERIIDLLYGELTPEEEKSLRADIESSEDLRAELEDYEDILGRVRDAAPVEEVPSSVHNSIMEAARAGIAEQAAEEARAARRPPENRDNGRAGIWARIANSQISQIGLVAAVLLAGAFVFKFVDLGSNRMEALKEGAEAPAPILQEAVTQSAEQPAQMQAQAQEEESAEFAEGEESVQFAEVEEEPAAEESTGRGVSRDQYARAEADRDRSQGPTRSARSKSTKRKPEDNLGQMLDSQKPAEKGIDDSVKRKARRRTARKPRPSAPAEKKSAPSAAKKKEEPLAMPTLDESQEEQAKAEAYRPPQGSIDAVEEAYRANDYSGTVSAADEFIEIGSGSKMEEARALDLKARALESMGRLREADRILAEIQSSYPTYRAQAVNEQRSEIARKLDTTRAREAPSKASEPADNALPAGSDF